MHLVWDNSSAFIPTEYAAERREGFHAFHGVRVHFENLSASRAVPPACDTASRPPEAVGSRALDRRGGLTRIPGREPNRPWREAQELSCRPSRFLVGVPQPSIDRRREPRGP